MNDCKNCVWSKLIYEEWGTDYECCLDNCCYEPVDDYPNEERDRERDVFKDE